MKRSGPIFMALLAAMPASAGAQTPASLAGRYDGAQMEMAAGLELSANGRFRYGLSYGALDEEAAGTWRVEDGQVVLTSDPVVAPRFVLLGQQRRADGRLKITLDLPDGMSRQYFHADVRLADGSAIEQQLSDEQEPLRLEPDQQPTAVTLALPMFDISGALVSLPAGGGYDLHFRFEPNDLGKVAFARTPLRNEAGVLILRRYDRTIRFSRIAP